MGIAILGKVRYPNVAITIKPNGGTQYRFPVRREVSIGSNHTRLKTSITFYHLSYRSFISEEIFYIRRIS